MRLPPGHLRELDEIVLSEYAGGTWVELGTYQGRSACILSQKCSRVVTVDREQVPTRLPDNVEFIKGRVGSVAKRFEDEIFDGLFIDAGHTTAAVISDFERWGPKVKPGGIIIFHDYTIIWPSVIRAVERLLEDGRVEWVELKGACLVTRKP